MDQMNVYGEVTVHVEASPDAVYDLVADVTRIGELSPECVSARWLGAEQGVPGARFQGRNVSKWIIRWSRVCEVVTADPGREFAFRTIRTRLRPDSTAWRYRFEPSGDGTDVTESYEIVELPPKPLQALFTKLLPHHTDMRPHMERTLEAIKRVVERERSGAGEVIVGDGSAHR
jgi:hypothetical protein